MSKFNTRASLIAAAVALALPGAALAVTAGYGAAGTATYASNVINASTTSLDIAAGATFGITATDNLAGRTSGFGVRITLDGAQFDTAGTAPTMGVSANQTGTFYDGIVPVRENVTGSIALFSVGAGAGPAPGMKVGNVLNINAFSIKNITKPVVTAKIEIYDPTTNAVLATATPYSLFTTKQAVVLDFVQSDSDAVAKRIDVVEGTTYAAKTAFSEDGSLGGADAIPAGAEYFNAGSLTLSVATYGPTAAPVPVLDETGSAFDYLATDELTYTVTSTGSLSPFVKAAHDGIFLSLNDDCSTNDIDATDVTGSVITFEGIDAAAVKGVAQYLCFVVDGDEEVIAAQTFTGTAAVDFSTAGYTDWSGIVSQDPLPLRYNGSVIQLFNVNPANNSTQESLLRYSNNSDRDYKVTLVGRDDAGDASTGSFSFDLAAGSSISLRSVEIENGSGKGVGALGAGSGKWVIEATAEGTGLVASGLNRSSLTGVISELNGEKHTDPADGTVVRAIP